MSGVLAGNHWTAGSPAAARRAALSLKQLIHSSITKARRLIEMFSHFSGARRRIVNHSPVVYFEISFGVALLFTQPPRRRRRVRLPPEAVLLHETFVSGTELNLFPV